VGQPRGSGKRATLRCVAGKLGVNFVEVLGSVLLGFGGPVSGAQCRLRFSQQSMRGLGVCVRARVCTRGCSWCWLICWWVGEARSRLCALIRGPIHASVCVYFHAFVRATGNAADRTLEARIHRVFEDAATRTSPCVLYIRRMEQALRIAGESSTEIRGQVCRCLRDRHDCRQLTARGS
jgi:hypothetical protein